MKDPFLQRLALIAVGAGIAIAGFLIVGAKDILVPLGIGLIGWGTPAPGHTAGDAP